MFAAVACIDSVFRRYYSYCWDDYSEQLLVDCTGSPNQGCNGGYVTVSLDYLKNPGMTHIEHYD